MVALIAPPAMAQPPATRPHVTLETLGAQNTRMRVIKQSFADAPAQITGIRVATTGETLTERAQDFLRRHERALGLEGVTLVVSGTHRIGKRTTVKFGQRIGDLEVWGKDARVTLDPQGFVLGFTSSASRLGQVLRGPVSAPKARTAAAQGVLGNASATPLVTAPTRVVLATPAGAVVVWRAVVTRRPLVDLVEVLIDTRDGRVVSTRQIGAIH